MKVDYWAALNLMPKYFHHLIFPYSYRFSPWPLFHIEQFGSIIAIAFCFLVCLYIGVYRNKWSQFSLLLSIVFILLPFSVLVNHFVPTREFWAVVPFFLLMTSWLMALQNIRGGQVISVFLCLMLLLFSWQRMKDQGYLNHVFQDKTVEEEKFKSHIEKHFVDKVSLYVIKSNLNHWHFSQYFAGFLAYNYPSKKFLLIQTTENALTYVTEGTYFNHDNKIENDWVDPYFYPTKNIIIPRGPQVIIALDEKKIKSLLFFNIVQVKNKNF